MILSAIVMLWKGADYFVDSAANIARSFNISELVIGLTLVGMGTSAPEFAVSVGAALSDKADISVSNIVGSNIFNLGFYFGRLRRHPAHGGQPQNGLPRRLYLVGISALLVFLIQDSVWTVLMGPRCSSFLGSICFFCSSNEMLEMKPLRKTKARRKQRAAGKMQWVSLVDWR